jgi:hypothetical protein
VKAQPFGEETETVGNYLDSGEIRGFLTAIGTKTDTLKGWRNPALFFVSELCWACTIKIAACGTLSTDETVMFGQEASK